VAPWARHPSHNPYRKRIRGNSAKLVKRKGKGTREGRGKKVKTKKGRIKKNDMPLDLSATKICATTNAQTKGGSGGGSPDSGFLATVFFFNFVAGTRDLRA
jgi:hypothetical protein